MSSRSGLHAYLVCASRLEFDFEPAPLRTSPQDAVMQNSVFGGRMQGIDNLSLGHAMPFVEVIGPSAFVGGDLTFDKCPIGFADGSVGKLRAKLARRAGVTGKGKRTGNRSVDSVRHSQVEVVARLLAFALAIVVLHLHF